MSRSAARPAPPAVIRLVRGGRRGLAAAFDHLTRGRGGQLVADEAEPATLPPEALAALTAALERSTTRQVGAGAAEVGPDEVADWLAAGLGTSERRTAALGALGSWSRVLVAAGAAEGEIARHLEQAHGRVLEQRWTRSASESSGLSQAKREGLVLPGWHPPTHQSGTSTSWSEAWAEVPALPASEALAPEPGRGENQWVVIEGGRRVGTVAPNDITEVDRWLDAATAAWVAAGAGPGAGEQP